MENLLVLLDKIQTLSPLPIFAQDTIVVQNAGMQHWLNMSLAQQRGISMNMQYALPSQFLWNLIRALASEDDVPEQSPYSREVLAWRIDVLLASDMVINDVAFSTATQYWQSSAHSQKSGGAYNDEEQLKRYQLACQLADLYEQYLIFRPEWIDAWHRGEYPAFDQHSTNHTHNETSDFSDNVADEDMASTSHAIWQGKLWNLLIEDQPYNPKELIALAINNLNCNQALQKQLLPHRLSFFGINAMAPLWLEFINALSQKVDIHFFHLNPCYAYWGDITTEKNAIESWIKGNDFSDADNTNMADINARVGNPLLANLGQQGREFMALLYQYSTINIDVFESAINDISPSENANSNHEGELKCSVLASIQQDILSLSDARAQRRDAIAQGSIEKSALTFDDSILITSAHSALREVQGLHDWLLHQFNRDKSLTPKDVLVMCPQVEQYAPYVNAVFTRGWQDIADEVPPLPCSIADRVSKDAEPLVAAFSELLNLPDSRFQVSSLIGLLRLPAMQKRFSITIEDIDKITVWLDLASIHWGLDKDHKAQILKQSQMIENADSLPINNSFTWQQGLARLLRGFAFGDQQVIYQDQMLLPTIEGDDSELLGKLLLIIEQLQHSSIAMSAPRSVSQWQQYLFSMLEGLFDDEMDNGLNIIKAAIESLVEYCQHAEFSDDISLTVLREFLNNHFSQPDPGRQFMVGQVTFCSMLPMRSIPFKVIAVLGLNDGEFPRQRQPLSFDLLATTPPQLGDRSRRGDDRYLFLEAIISARQALYLSYQGRNIKNNKERQPSLVLKELMEYLARGYGWPLLDINDDKEQADAIRQLPMQAFSTQNYQGRYASFDANWLALSGYQTTKLNNENTEECGSNDLNIDEASVGHSIEIQTGNDVLATSPNTDVEHNENMFDIDAQHELLAADIIRFYQHPSRYYAQRQLYLYLDNTNTSIEDIEPFVPDRLESYLLREALINYYLSPEQSAQSADDIVLNAKLAGKLPDLPTTSALIQGWQQDSQVFSEYIQTELACNGSVPITMIDCQLNIAPSLHSLDVIPVNTIHDSATPNIPQNIKLIAKLPRVSNKLVFYRSSSAKAKDLFTLYLHQLIVQVAQIEPEHNELHQVVSTHGYYFDTKNQKPTQFYFSDIPDAKAKLTALVTIFYLGQNKPLLLNGELAEKVRKSKVFEQSQFEQFWHNSNVLQAFGDDEYIRYFWHKCPEFELLSPMLLSLYQPMFDALQVVK